MMVHFIVGLIKKDLIKYKLVAKVNSIDTCRFVLKTKYDTDKLDIENKIPDTNGIVKKIDYNTKIAEIEGKIPDVSSLATKTALTTGDGKICDVTSLVKKKQIIMQKRVKLKRDLLTIIMINILQLQSLIF